jgi:hypothetical protein
MARLGVVSAEVGVAGDGSLITAESRDGGLNRRRRVVGIFTMLTTCPAKGWEEKTKCDGKSVKTCGGSEARERET